MTHLGLGVLWVGDTSNYRSSRDCGKKLPCLWQSLLRDRYKNMYFLVWPSFFWGYDWGFLSSILHLFLLHSLDCNLSVEDHGTAASRLSRAPFGQREPLSPGCQFPYKGSHGLWHYGETHLSPKPPDLGWGACGSREGGEGLHLNSPVRRLFFWWNKLEEVRGREDRGSYWISLILSFVSLWIAFVYTVSSGQEFLQQKHAYTWGYSDGASFLSSCWLGFPLYRLIWKEGWGYLTGFGFFCYMERDVKYWLEANVLMTFLMREEEDAM